MIRRFTAAQPPHVLSKPFLIAVAAIALVLALAAIAVSQIVGDDPYVYQKGVVKPEGIKKFVDPHGHEVNYNASMMGRAANITRNGKAWLTLKTAPNGDVQIFDAAGSTKPVIVIPAAASSVKKMPGTR